MDNRRTKLTKKLIKDATLELLETKSQNKLTITDICKTADVNRSTFYSYYDTINNLLDEIENDILNKLPNIKTLKNNNKKEFIDMLESFFYYLKENNRIFKILIMNNYNDNFIKKLIETVIKNYPYRINDKTKEKFSYIYCVNGVIGLIKEWINDDFDISIEEFSKIVYDMSSKIIEINDYKMKI